MEDTSQHTTSDSIMQQSAENLKTEVVTTLTKKTEIVRSNVNTISLIVGIVVSVIGVSFIIIALKITTLKYRRKNSD
jgi:beta-lactamase regulating signal transducer with metallopeptidase domain